PGSASTVSVTFVDAAITPAFAVVVLASSGGGSGTFYTLHAVSGQGATLSVGAGVLIGDRIKVGSISIINGQVRLTVTRSGPNDPACCPTQQAILTYGFDARGLSLLSTVVPAIEPTPGPPRPAATGSAGIFGDRDTFAGGEFGLLLALVVASGYAR